MSSLRSKRNFKGLGLSAGAGSSSSPDTPLLVPAPDGGLIRKAPPPISTSSSRVASSSSLHPSSDHDASTPNAQRNLHATISNTLANLDLKRRRFNLKNDEFTNIQELGMGNGGSVMKVEHVASRTVMAKKVRPSSRLTKLWSTSTTDTHLVTHR